MKLRILSADDVAQALPVAAAVDAVRDAFLALHRGEVRMPTRLQLDAGDGVSLFMPATDAGRAVTSLKVVSVYPGNVERGLAAINGLVMVIDAATGVPQALLEGGLLTALRTGASSGVATDALARADASSLAVIGAGAQAPYQALAVAAVRPIEHVRIWNRTRERADALAARLRDELPGAEVGVSGSAREAVRDVDVVCTATSATRPVLATSHLPDGVHVNAVGSFRPEMRELPRDLFGRASRIVVDEIEATFDEAGEIIDAVDAGTVAREDLLELGAVVAGAAPGRTADDQVTVFKSCGLAVQDLYAAARAVEAATETGLGTVTDL